MGTPNTVATPTVESNLAAVSLSSDELAAKAMDKRYEGLIITARAFSVSNPSRTASEHLKKGTCPQLFFCSRSSSSGGNRSGDGKGGGGTAFSVQQVPPLAMVDPSRFTVELAYPPVILMAHTSAVPVAGDASPCVVVSNEGRMYGRQPQQQLVLSDWIYQCCGSVSLSTLEHPKFKAFLNQIGLPAISRKEFMGSRLDAKYDESKAESEGKISDTMLCQIALMVGSLRIIVGTKKVL
ncbi:Hypothetical predicted protein [Olea europaea subsp. europaea]|uniref:DUF7963 domain-containing protein n=1 Tax=Olea europaea subsp. europaea TaxID=158383 RepID=A0A8S0RI54_OLEEU|nr:Hypothetical predicted protein [Olea europaea subsp. europaea]